MTFLSRDPFQERNVQSLNTLQEQYLNTAKDYRSREILIKLRKITQAIDLHSKYLLKTVGMTSPQLVILHELSAHEALSVSELSKSVSL